MEPVHNVNTASSLVEKIWAVHKYDVMSKGYNHYRHCSSLTKGITTFLDITLMLQTLRILKGKPYDYKAVINTMEHMWGYIKKEAAVEEKNIFYFFLKWNSHIPYRRFYQWPGHLNNAYRYFLYLLDKYPQPYLQNSSIIFPEKYNVEIKTNKGIFIVKYDILWKKG
ncbi:hypothetical protein J2S78_000242 [Salibacterium salarium]|uniref:DUF1722 domain-containing protein n=1 Tax=Salibacterium salarium TaxID=284579 RepID=UPI00277F62F8|nr:DUF1722 domain-containing protein [Salibacterium salarium]MDQ0297834.1 hypothetical protein [Salibacterium salarium]